MLEFVGFFSIIITILIFIFLNFIFVTPFYLYHIIYYTKEKGKYKREHIYFMKGGQIMPENRGCGGFGFGDDCCWIIIVILLFFCCCGGNRGGCC